jgi:hypothetical protein
LSGARSAAPRHNGPSPTPSASEQHQEHQHSGNRDDHPHPWLHDSSPSSQADPYPRWPSCTPGHQSVFPRPCDPEANPAESGVEVGRAHITARRRTPDFGAPTPRPNEVHTLRLNIPSSQKERAGGLLEWSYDLPKTLRAGRYVALATGGAEPIHAARNSNSFRLVDFPG